MPKQHPHLKGDESLMDMARRNRAAVEAGITDPLTAFMAIFHPEVDMFTPTMREAREASRKGQRGGY